MSTHWLADRTGLFDASGIRKDFDLGAKLSNPTNLTLGQPDFDVPETIKQAAIAAIEQGANGYSQTAGDGALRARIASQVKTEFGWDNVGTLVTSGVSGSLLLAFMSLINPGDEVIMPSYTFVSSANAFALRGASIVFGAASVGSASGAVLSTTLAIAVFALIAAASVSVIACRAMRSPYAGGSGAGGAAFGAIGNGTGAAPGGGAPGG